MKKLTKILATLTATVLGASTLAIAPLSSSAESAFALGDVDRDGIITGHDSAVVSRYLNVDPTLLDNEQLILADINEDGIIDQTDADLIHENEVYTIGDVDGSGSTELIEAWIALSVYAKEQVDLLNITQTDSTFSNYKNVGDYTDVTDLSALLL